MAKRKLVAANWKMNKTIGEADAFADVLLRGLDAVAHCDLLVAPPFLALPRVAERMRETPVMVAAQDVYWEAAGAFTGEVSCGMIREAGGQAVIVGHSERRHVLGEDNETVARKLRAVIEAGLFGVLCVGETLEDREAGRHETVVRSPIVAAPGGGGGRPGTRRGPGTAACRCPRLRGAPARPRPDPPGRRR